MRLGNTTQSWGLIARVLHWSIAAFIIGQFITGWVSENTADRALSNALILTHFQFGVVLTGLIVMRVLWRMSHKPPEPPPGEPVWRERVAQIVHILIYVLLIILPIAGYIVWVHMQMAMDVFGLFTVPALFTPQYEDQTFRASAWYVHHYGSWMLFALSILHVAAALFHQFGLKDGLMRRMTG